MKKVREERCVGKKSLKGKNIEESRREEESIEDAEREKRESVEKGKGEENSRFLKKEIVYVDRSVKVIDPSDDTLVCLSFHASM